MKKLLLVVSLALVSVQGAWAADKMLADRHVERGLKCESCHTTMPPKAVNTRLPQMSRQLRKTRSKDG